jgi:excisionase family DNA binding protein
VIRPKSVGMALPILQRLQEPPHLLHPLGGSQLEIVLDLRLVQPRRKLVEQRVPGVGGIAFAHARSVPPADPFTPSLNRVAAREKWPRMVPVVRNSNSRNEAARNRRISPLDSGPYLMGPAGFEPATPTVSTGAGASDGFSSPVTPSHPADNTGPAASPAVHRLAPAGTATTPHGAPVVRVPVASRAQLHAIQGGAGRLLTVRDVAERLAVSTATVYALCERGELPHLRVSNAIRIRPDDLKAFIAGGPR